MNWLPEPGTDSSSCDCERTRNAPPLVCLCTMSLFLSVCLSVFLPSGSWELLRLLAQNIYWQMQIFRQRMFVDEYHMQITRSFNRCNWRYDKFEGRTTFPLPLGDNQIDWIIKTQINSYCILQSVTFTLFDISIVRYGSELHHIPQWILNIECSIISTIWHFGRFSNWCAASGQIVRFLTISRNLIILLRRKQLAAPGG